MIAENVQLLYMKLIYLANQRLPTEKAYGIQIGKMCEAFAAQGLNVELLIPKRKNPSGKNVFDYYKLLPHFKITQVTAPDFYWPGFSEKTSFVLKQFISSWLLITYILRHNSDIVYSRDDFVLCFLSYFRKGLYFEAHRFSEKRKWLYRQLIRSGIKVITVSKGLKEVFVRFGFKDQNVFVAPDGVDTRLFSEHLDIAAARQKLSLIQKIPIIGYVGQLKTLGMEKGIQELFDAFEYVVDQYPQALLLLVGGSQADIAHYQKVISPKIKNSVSFAGYQEPWRVPLYLWACDVLVMPYPNEPHYAIYMSPLKLFEYMASGRPVVASDLPSVREVLNSNNAILVMPNDARDLANGIQQILSKSDPGLRLANQAQSDVVRYSWDQRAKNI